MISPTSKRFEPPAGNWVNAHSWPQETRIDIDSLEFSTGDGYGMSRVFQQMEQYLETGTCECEQVIDFAVKLELKFR